jgi:hypothetical protein
MYILSEYAVILVSVFVAGIMLFSVCLVALTLKEAARVLDHAWYKFLGIVFQGPEKSVVLADRGPCPIRLHSVQLGLARSNENSAHPSQGGTPFEG